MRNILQRCRTVLANMALENEGAIFRRWPINHEPLRADARNLLPLIDDVLRAETDVREELAEYLYQKFDRFPGEWAHASVGLKDLWRRYADGVLTVVCPALGTDDRGAQ